MKHTVSLPYVKDFDEGKITTKARPIQMSQETMEFCRNEIEDLLRKSIICKSKSPWSCSAFYVQKNVELERGAPRLVINYKPLNKVLEWIRYPIPNKRDLINRLSRSVIFSKFDMKSGFWQIQIHEKDKYKTSFVTSFGQYEWNVMPFGLKNALSEFQNIMNDILSPFSKYSIVYIDGVLIFSKSIEEHWKHLNSFIEVIKVNGLVVSATKIKLFQTNIRLQKNPPPWTEIHTSVVKEVKLHVQTLPCLGIPTIDSFKIVEIDASDIVYGGILKQQVHSDHPEQIVRFHSGKKMEDKKKEKVPTKKSNLSPESKPFELVTPSQLSSRDLVSRSPPIQLPPEPITEQAPKSESPISSKGKMPAEKDFKAFALAEQFFEQNEENSDEESTAESSVPRSQFDLFQDAQDPFDRYDLSCDY
ncbi:uncharacterized protein LOC133876857 [Alnus glutinosa]|uniref:uncharacterized protein LOC133876857 n=1 Tax=Alnus glutinosa TaxID=3517 RepID=UPI002D77A593|nr:uncharacterized protein LOC133876857 [Alnus glutinosa]